MRIYVVLSIVILLLTACSSDEGDTNTPGVEAVSITDGDATRGAELFNATINRQPSCASCHSLDGSAGVGPTLAGFGAVARVRVEGESAHEYAYSSLVDPGAYLVGDHANVMPATYSEMFTRQELADLVAYILDQ
jgi:mono/diheme cytochrome c family protein